MRPRWKLTLLVMALGLVWVAAAFAQQVNPPPSQFSITGFIEEATLSPRVGGHSGQPAGYMGAR